MKTLRRGALCLCVLACRRSPPAAPPRPTGHVETLAAHRRSPHADGAAGDLVLRHTQGATLVIARGEDREGARPLRGAVLDLGASASDTPDPLLWWRPAWSDGRGFHTGPAQRVEPTRCGHGGEGLRTVAVIDAVSLDTTYCAMPDGDFWVETRAADLPPGGRLGDEIHPGSAAIFVQARGQHWEGETASPFVALAEHNTALVFSAQEATPVAARSRVRIAREIFPAAVRWIAGESRRFVRRVRVLRGDAFDALGAATPRAGARVIDLVGPSDLPGRVELLDAAGAVLAEGVLGASRRRLVLPGDLGVALRVRDARGVDGPELPLPPPRETAVTLRAPSVDAGRVRMTVTDPAGRALPVRVVFRAHDGRALRPELGRADRGFAHDRTVYLYEGKGSVMLPPGQYHVAISRGLGYTLYDADVTVTPARDVDLVATLRDALPTGDRLSADLHLHASPSPDSSVSLEERVGSLACNGIDFAVATDHNRITDYGPALARTGLGPWLSTMVGDEITSVGAPLWGHFNAFPLPADAPHAPAYFNVSPREIFAAARAGGATLLQVNHPRMPPNIGYFNLAHLDPDTGRADPAFAEGFDAVEVHNGVWLESPAEVRRALVDVVGLARRGMRVTATGNSDSHKLFLNEAGFPRTWVLVAPTPRETLGARTVEALRQGRSTVSSGPFVEITVNGFGPGSTVTLPSMVGGLPGVRVHVRVSAPAWVPVDRVELWRDETVFERVAITSGRIDGVRWEGDFTVPLDRDASILAWAESDTPLPEVLPYRDARPIGFTSPVWVDADGDGAFRLARRAERVTSPSP